ncbi:hypothetical protein MXD62_14915 [Frankia sp. Mgl5]|uniref:hypothetical protein n=1 Tax=Frankia sp. Mgl5 TaxID=2933793 RepID=UPI00200EA06A|nr:hypothetical protein [Frankia sp. Mgl5]MCK9928448.1 hypothetical protein [Frankia sp. Mgl5]
MTRLVLLGGVSSPHAEEIALAICAEILAVLTARITIWSGSAGSHSGRHPAHRRRWRFRIPPGNA